MCSLVSSSLSLQDRVDAQDTSEHIGAHPCPVCPYLSFQHHGDTEDMSEHISARLCPCPCPFNTMGTPRTRVSTPVLASVLCVLISVSLDSQNSSEHIGAHWCSV